MRLSLNNDQWHHLCVCAECASAFPATIGNFLQYFTEKKDRGNFNMAYDHSCKVFGVWYSDELRKFESTELIDAMYDMFCYMEGI
jgi:hypothetical protein